MEYDQDGPSGYRHLGHVRTRGEDLAAVVTPSVRQALAAGARVLIACPDAVVSALTGCWESGDDVRALATPQQERRPAGQVAEIATLIDRHLPDDGRRLHLVTAVEAPVGGWATCMQTESLFNHVLSGRPVDHLCLLGAAAETTGGPDVGPGPEDVVRAAHPFLLTGAGVIANPDYRVPSELLTELQRATVPDPLEASEPVLSLIDLDDMRAMRRSVRRVLADSHLDQDIADDFVLAIDEIVANAAEHGVPPVDVRLWCGRGRLLCSITDRGACFDDPLAGYGPAHGDMAVGGMGLWLARRSVDSLVAAPAEEIGGGCTVRLVVNA
jgi:anti-sigma regulatory factor (Ser/Thr protein kinase)